MKIDRRNLLAAALAAGTFQIGRSHETERVSQSELNEAIRLHGMWLTDIDAGRRCAFAGRDLSGLQFEAVGGGPINLNGADFAEANLSETKADDIRVHHCNFHGANFDGCRWRQPVFSFCDMRRVSAKEVAWGSPGSEGSHASFIHAALNYADLTKAQICGFFSGTSFGNASLLEADMSYSEFLGFYHDMSFAGAQLREAKLRHCRISSASFFHADCTDADFSHTRFSDMLMNGCNLSGACFRGAEIERTMLSPDQMSQTDFSALGSGDPLR